MSKKPTRGAFGGHYNHEVIRQLRAQLAQSNLILAALIDHTKISKEDLQRVASEFFTKQQQAMEQKKG